MTQDKSRWRAVVNTVMNLHGPRRADNFLTSWAQYELLGKNSAIWLSYRLITKEAISKRTLTKCRKETKNAQGYQEVLLQFTHGWSSDCIKVTVSSAKARLKKEQECGKFFENFADPNGVQSSVGVARLCTRLPSSFLSTKSACDKLPVNAKIPVLIKPSKHLVNLNNI
jgi:hypothetical protein